VVEPPAADPRLSAPAKISSLCVFCGSASRVAESHRAAAARLGSLIAKRGMRLVYGGGRVGLMGILADAALAGGASVVGVIPEFLVGLEVAHRGLTELHTVDSMHARKRRMADLADAFVVLSGGIGTLDETFEIVSWKQLGLHEKPIVLVSIDGFWKPFAALIESLVAAGFAQPEHTQLFSVVSTIEEAFESLAAAQESAGRADSKWI
jgi:hypothetical protein